MRRLTLVEPRRLEWEDVDEPELEGPKEAVVRPLAVARCDLDLPMVLGEAPFPPPIALGHEFVAEVVAVEEGVDSVAPGDRVVVPFQISCGECGRCRAGLTQSCSTVPNNSMYGFGQFGGDWGGALADLVRVPFADAMLLPVPGGVDPATAASADNIPDGWRTVAGPLERHPGASVLVLGGQALSIGLYAVASAVTLGAGAVTYIDTDEERLRIARELGADAVEGPPPRKHGAHEITVDANGSHEGLHCAIRSTAPGGECTSCAIYFEPETPLPMLEMYTVGVTLHSSRVAARAALPAVLDSIAAGALRSDVVTTRTVSWEAAPEAYAEEATKLVVVR